jgi:hypothetical protein
LGGQQQQQFVHGPAHPAEEDRRLGREPRRGDPGHDCLGHLDQVLLVEIGQGQPGKLLVYHTRKLRNPGRELAREMLPGLPEIRQPLVRGRATRLLDHPAAKFATEEGPPA